MKYILHPGLFLLLFALLLNGCVTTQGPVSASGTPVATEALKTAQDRVASEGIPLELCSHYVALYSQGPQNSVLHAMRGGLAAFRIGRYDLSRSLFDRAIKEVESLQEGVEQAERTKSKFVGDEEKWFKGESHERAALYFYRALIYLNDHDFGNAAACFKRSLLQDLSGDDAKENSADWYSDEWGLALASSKNGFPQDAEAALERASKFPNRQGEIPAPRHGNSALIFIETGGAPYKYRSGRYGEQLRFAQQASPIKKIICQPAQQDPISTAAAESLYVQATTRGTRQVDYILRGKAEFKQGTEAATVGLGAAALATASTTRSQEGQIASGVLGLLAVGSAIMSASTKTEADIRMWDNLPDSIFLVCCIVPSTQTSIKVKGIDAHGHVVKETVLECPANSGNDLKLLTLKW